MTKSDKPRNSGSRLSKGRQTTVASPRLLLTALSLLGMSLGVDAQTNADAAGAANNTSTRSTQEPSAAAAPLHRQTTTSRQIKFKNPKGGTGLTSRQIKFKSSRTKAPADVTSNQIKFKTGRNKSLGAKAIKTDPELR